MNKPAEEPRKISEVIKDYSYLLPVLAALITFMAPVGYLFGIGYYSGYLGVFGVPTSALQLSVTDAYVHGYYAVALYLKDMFAYFVEAPLLNWFIYSVVFLLALAYFLAKVTRYNHPNPERFKPIPQRILPILNFLNPKHNDFILSLKIVYELLSHVGTIAYLIFVFLFAWWMVTVISYWKGQELAEGIKRDFADNGCVVNQSSQLSKCIQILDKNGEKVIEGYLIGLGDKRYIIFTNDGPVISTLPEGAIITKKFDRDAYVQQSDDSQLVASSDSE